MTALSLFRRVSVLAAVFAYLQIALGGIVRVSGSGLGCPDWPLCHGRPYPPANLHAIIEYSHRTVGTITGLLIIATVAGAWIVFRNRRPIVAWVATASLVAIAVEGALGGVVVAHELAPWLVAVHLGLAMIILGALIATAALSMPESPGVESPAFARLSIAAVAGTYVLLLTGSSVVASDADRTCHTWPLCGSGFSLDFSGVNAFTMVHRGAVLVIGLLLVYFAWTAVRQCARWARIFAVATLVALALQVLAGAVSAITDAALANGIHVALGTLVWGGVCTTAALSLPRSDRAPVESGAFLPAPRGG
ncbi:MAG TPA: COX15/CtaA family protein [Candidatus Dormibacteraeota bacterium]|nr:COX15/CtaA family protein [Candidatus Dormibacteraeota bacterium]